jgi:Rnl2 family RNA ligase
MFKKYPSILNHYRSKEIDWWTEQYPDLLTAKYEIQEKIHGANIQLIFTPNEPLVVCSRNRILVGDEDFYGVKELLSNQLSEFVRGMQFVADASETITVYGEVFGPGIQKGVQYGTEKQLVFFDVALSGDLLAPNFAKLFFKNIGEEELYIHQFALVEGLSEALEFDTELISAYGPDDPENLIEGVVIKPAVMTYKSHQGSWFYIKKKNESFKEKAKAAKPKPAVDSELEKLHLEFLSYITPMRLQAVFSKHGEISQPSEIGKYIKLVLADAKEDFEQEQEIPELNKKDLKYIYNVGSMIANMLKGYL